MQVPHKETDPTDPWTPIANFKLKAEKALTTVPDLKYTILRPAIVYGPGDKMGISKCYLFAPMTKHCKRFTNCFFPPAPRLVIAAIYRYLGETMKVLWNRDLLMNTIHVYDLCRAICFVAQNATAVGQVYNVVDEGCTTQGIINDIISKIFNIKTAYIDNVITTMFKDRVRIVIKADELPATAINEPYRYERFFLQLDLDSIAKDINDKHSLPWAQLCEKNEIRSTPLSSFLHKEELYNKHLFLDCSKLIQLGFTLTHPRITEELVIEVLRSC